MQNGHAKTLPCMCIMYTPLCNDYMTSDINVPTLIAQSPPVFVVKCIMPSDFRTSFEQSRLHPELISNAKRIDV